MNNIISLLDQQIATERKIKLLMKRIINKKEKYKEKTIKLAMRILDNARRNEQQYLAQSKQKEKRLRTNGNTSNGKIIATDEEKIFISEFLSARGN